MWYNLHSTTSMHLHGSLTIIPHSLLFVTDLLLPRFVLLPALNSQLTLHRSYLTHSCRCSMLSPCTIRLRHTEPTPRLHSAAMPHFQPSYRFPPASPMFRCTAPLASSILHKQLSRAQTSLLLVRRNASTLRSEHPITLRNTTSRSTQQSRLHTVYS